MKKLKLSKAQVSTAIFEYLLNRGKRPNRKKGVAIIYQDGMCGPVVDKFLVKVK